MAKVYVGTYAKYNEGSLRGAWLDLANYETYEDFLRACKKLHDDEEDAEFMIQDCEDFPDGLSPMEWLSRDDFNAVKIAMKEEQQETEGKPAINIIDYSEKAFAVVGDTKPVKEELKKMGGRFNGKLYCGAGWIFSNRQRDDVERFISSGHVAEKVRAERKDSEDDKALLEEYMKEIGKAWTDKSMLDYFRKDFSYAVRLTNGGLLLFGKPRIETRFCFHDEGPDYEFYKKLMSKEERLAQYFKSENLAQFDNMIERIKGRDGEPHDVFLYRQGYYSQTDKLNLWKVTFLSHWDYENRIGDTEYVLATEEDKKIILEAYKHERAKFEKRLDTYLKRYGTSKLHTWTYWADA